MVKRVFIIEEEKYEPFELHNSECKDDIIISDKLYERYKMIHTIAEVMRDYMTRRDTILRNKQDNAWEEYLKKRREKED